MTSPREVLERIRNRRMVKKTGFWFVDVPRTSSSSVRHQLGTRFGRTHGKRNAPDQPLLSTDQIIRDHQTAIQMRDYLGMKTWNRLTTFSIVRNPWDRASSLYFYLRKQSTLPSDWSLSDFVDGIAAARSGDVHTAVRYAPLRLSNSEFVTDENNVIIVDHIIKFEDRQNGLRDIGKAIGHEDLGTVKFNDASPAGVHYSAHFDERTKRRVAEIFAEDLERFEYRFETD